MKNLEFVTMTVTRRHFGKLVLAGGPGLVAIARLGGLASSAMAQAAAKPSRSYIK